MIFGMPTLIEVNSLEETMALCKELNLQFVELNMNLPQYQTDLLENTDNLLRLKEKYNIFYTIHLDENLNICDFNKAVSKAYIDTVKRTIKTAKIIGSPILNMHMNHGVHFTLPNCKVELFEKYNDIYMESWKIFRYICEDLIGNHNIKLSIENTDGFRNYEKEAINYLLQSEVFTLTWDIGHSHSVGNIDEGFIMEHENKLAHFHIHDALGKQNHMTLGSGEIALGERLKIADRNNCRCVIETKTVSALRKSVSYLKTGGKI